MNTTQKIKEIILRLDKQIYWNEVRILSAQNSINKALTENIDTQRSMAELKEELGIVDDEQPR